LRDLGKGDERYAKDGNNGMAWGVGSRGRMGLAGKARGARRKGGLRDTLDEFGWVIENDGGGRGMASGGT